MQRCKNLDRSLVSMRLWNEEARAHVGQGQVAACSWVLRAQMKVAHLSPEGTGGVRATRTLPRLLGILEEGPGQVLGILGEGGQQLGRRGGGAVGFKGKNRAGRSPS